MKAVEIIDNKIEELRKIRRIVVKGERRFSKENEFDKFKNLSNELEKHGIPFSVFEFGTGIFIKIEDTVSEKDDEDLGDVSGQVFDPNC